MVTVWEPVYCRHPCDPVDCLVSVHMKAFKYSYDVSLYVLLFLYDSYKVMRERV